MKKSIFKIFLAGILACGTLCAAGCDIIFGTNPENPGNGDGGGTPVAGEVFQGIIDLKANEDSR